MDYQQKSIAARMSHGGAIFTGLVAEPSNKEALSTYYSPGIAGPCLEIAKDKAKAFDLTIKKNTVAVISDGSAVLGLGNIGPEAALPVMEGKCMLLKHFGGVDGIPIVLDTQDTEEIIETILRIAPTFGGINLEDISAPRCFEIEARLSEKLNIPVFHDDQHGTAICTVAALINALQVVGKEKESVKVVISGAGAGGIAIAKLVRQWGVKNIVMTDSKGVVSCARDNLNEEKQNFCTHDSSQTLAEALVGADVFIGASKANILTPVMVHTMAKDPVVFALANPDPEMHPSLAEQAGVAVMATGRSDYPNQINNVLVFPGLFRGLLDHRIKNVTDEIKLSAAQTLAALVENPRVDCIIPDPFDVKVSPAMAKSVLG
ncbi:NAD-dependent malic enzyme [bacterium]|nr:NAD-dependent malic enzyme [bacterium]NCQ55080.1 NAD-dependent malic enzyme [Candidatus Parcubacteria bacterium]NCS67124.1 NAD-dependent malic enzyme [Candidatus Peregrinibacteria bacterium]NCS96070.1 NAD-dependent malic enzyme [bacterium]